MPLAGWADKKIQIIIPASGIVADLIDFPVNLLLSASAGIESADLTDLFTEIGADANRKKIAITQSDDITECYVEIERWDNANKKASLHVKVPSVSSTVDTVLYLYFDSTHDDNITYVGDSAESPAESVWDSNYKAIYHFAQDPSAGSPQLIDSTSNGNNGTNSGGMDSGDLIDAGIGGVQRAWDFDFDTDYVDIGVPLVIGANQDFTIESLIHPDVVGVTTRRLWSTARGTGAASSPILQNAYDGSAHALLYGDDYNGDVYSVATSSTIVTTTPQLITSVRDGAEFKVIKDDEAPNITTTSELSYDNGDNTHLGYAGGGGFTFSGSMIEVRISDIPRSEAWYKATYKTLYDALVIYELDTDGDLAAELPLLESDSISGATVATALPALSSYSEAYVDHIESADVTLPSLILEIISGASMVSTLELLEVTTSGLHSPPFFGDSILPALTVDAIPGMIGAIDFGAVSFTGSGLQGVIGGVNDFLPKLIGDAYLNIVQHGVIDVRMKRLLVAAAATVGSAYNLSLLYPSLSLEIEAVFGAVGNIDINLPAIEEAGLNSYNDIIGNMTGELNI